MSLSTFLLAIFATLLSAIAPADKVDRKANGPCLQDDSSKKGMAQRDRSVATRRYMLM